MFFFMGFADFIYDVVGIIDIEKLVWKPNVQFNEIGG